MHNSDPISRAPELPGEGDVSLSRGLRHLSAKSPQGAPAELRILLNRTFKDHHLRRRRARMARLTLLAASIIVVISTALLLAFRSAGPNIVAQKAPPALRTPTPPVTLATLAAANSYRLTGSQRGREEVERLLHNRKRSESIRRGRIDKNHETFGPGDETTPPSSAGTPILEQASQQAAEVDSDAFVALPSFDPAAPTDGLEIVRLEMPATVLRLVGFPIREDVSEYRVVADVLLAQDGTPYALRFVQ